MFSELTKPFLLTKKTIACSKRELFCALHGMTFPKKMPSFLDKTGGKTLLSLVTYCDFFFF